MTFIKDVLMVILYQPLYNILIFLINIIPGHSVGLAIVVLTLIIRFALYPSTKKSLIAQKKIRKLQPKLDEIKEQYKGDVAAQNTALMELYKKEEINPLGSCLPMLIQLPIFYVLYRVFINGLSTVQTSLLYSFIPRTDSINTMFFGLDLSKKELIILPLITAILQFWQSKQLMPKKQQSGKEDPTVAMTKQMMYIFPVMIFITARSLPAALPLYWAVNSLFSIVQQWYLLKESTEELEEKMTKTETITPRVEKSEKEEYAKGKDVSFVIRKKPRK